MNRIGTVVILLLCMALPGAPSLAAAWQPIGLSGMEIGSLATVPGAVYAGSSGDGIFRLGTADPAGVWVPIGPPGASIVSIWPDSERPGRIFAVGGGGELYRTRDGGGSWDALAPPAGATESRAIHGRPGEPVIYLGGRYLWISRDDGDSWEQLTIFSAHALEIDPIGNKAVWYGGSDGTAHIFTSRSGEQGWHFVDTGSGNEPLSIAASPLYKDVTLVGRVGSVLRVSHLGRLVLHRLAGGSDRYQVDWDNVVSQRAYAAGFSASGGRAYETRDTGFTWTDITGALATRQVHALRADAATAGAVYVGTDDGVYRLTD